MGKLAFVAVVLSLGGACASSPPARDTTADPAAPPGAEPPQQTEPPVEENRQADPIGAYMAEHFAVATFARDALINGELDLIRRPLTRLAEYDYEAVVPGGWFPWVAQMQQAARLTAGAERLDAAASGVATLARVCGECHRATGGGPDFRTAPVEAVTPEHDELPSRMYRHMWAADRLWEGLTGPSDEAWIAGAKVLAAAPAQGPDADPPLPAAFQQLLSEVRELGQRGLEATTLEARADLYAPFLASCAGCHAHTQRLDF